MRHHSLLRAARALALAIAVLPAVALAATATRGPFLQQTNAHGTLVVLSTDAAAAVHVVASLPEGGTVEGSSSGTRHVVRLDGLPAASEIPYQVTIDGAPGSTGTIRTPGEPGTAAGRRAVLGAIGDYGTLGPNEFANVARLAEEKVAALLTVGDNGYPDGTAADFDSAVFRPLAPLLPSTTFWPGLGDHEYRTAWAQPYLDAFELPGSERFYSFDWGDVHVIALDTNCITPLDASTAGCTTASMVAWLRDDLAKTAAPWKIVTMHRPAVAAGHYDNYPEIATALVPVFQEGGVDLVLQGHNHLYERTWPTRDNHPVQKDYDHPRAPVYVTTGGGGDWLYDFSFPPADFTAYREKTGQHLVLTLDGGTLDVTSVRPDGTIHDQFTIVKDVPPLPLGEGGAGGGDGTPPTVVQGCASSGAAPALLALAGIALAGLVRRRRTPPAR